MSVIDLLKEYGCFDSVCRICDLIKIDFSAGSDVICLHTQSALFRGLKFDDLLISSDDIFVPGKNYKKRFLRKFKWDIPGNTLFDDRLEIFTNEISNKKVKDVAIKGKDLLVDLEDGYRIEVLANTFTPDSEIYRIFKKDDLESHIVVETADEE